MTLMKILSAILIFVSLSYSLGMDGYAFSTGQNSQAYSSMDNAQESHEDCNADSAWHHDCHLTHCGFVILGSKNIAYSEYINDIIPFYSSLYKDVSLAGPRKPPRT